MEYLVCECGLKISVERLASHARKHGILISPAELFGNPALELSDLRDLVFSPRTLFERTEKLNA